MTEKYGHWYNTVLQTLIAPKSEPSITIITNGLSNLISWVGWYRSHLDLFTSVLHLQSVVGSSVYHNGIRRSQIPNETYDVEPLDELSDVLSQSTHHDKWIIVGDIE